MRVGGAISGLHYSAFYRKVFTTPTRSMGTSSRIFLEHTFTSTHNMHDHLRPTIYPYIELVLLFTGMDEVLVTLSLYQTSAMSLR